jgi:starch-binding outer membrane protein, SusD/RagB family
MTTKLRPGRLATFFAAIAIMAGCGDFLTVDDPGQFTDEDLDEALEAVARGVEGDFATGYDQYIIVDNLLSDVWRHTGTWVGYEEVDRGRIHYANSGQTNGSFHTMLRVRASAISAEERFARVLGESEARSSPLTVQVKSFEGWTNLILGQGWCEAPSGPMEGVVPDTQLYEQAVTAFTEGIQLASGLNLTEWEHFNRAGRARAHLFLGNYPQALADAQAIPDGFRKYAIYSSNTARQMNSIVTLNTRGFNHAAGMREKWWDQVDTDAGALRDPWTGEIDPRVPIVFQGELGVNGRTPHFSQWKYQSRGSDIPITHAEEMRLIEAEVHWRNGDLETAVGILDQLRAAAGLSALPATGDAIQVRDYLLHERFAILFMEGQRQPDLHRFGLVGEMSVLVDGEETFGTGRPTKFPMSHIEARATPGVEDDAAVRCLPTA